MWKEAAYHAESAYGISAAACSENLFAVSLRDACGSAAVRAERYDAADAELAAYTVDSDSSIGGGRDCTAHELRRRKNRESGSMTGFAVEGDDIISIYPWASHNGRWRRQRR